MSIEPSAGPASADGKPPVEKSNGVPWLIPLIIAVVLIAVYLLVLWLLFQTADDEGVEETVWGRYIFLLAGFEAIVFTAVGWLFGREVNRKQAEQAEEATAAATKATGEAEQAKSDGRALQNAILSTPEPGEFEGASEKTSLGQLRSFAQKYTF